MKKFSHLVSLGVTLGILSSVFCGAPTNVASAYPTHLPVTLYVDSEFSGGSQELDVGNHDLSALTIGNDKLTSLRVTPGYQVTLYQDSGFSGSSVVVTSDNNNLGSLSFNDKTSSLRIAQVNPVDSSCIQITSWDNAAKLSLLQTFAPRIWQASGETYWPASVEWTSQYTTRYLNTNINQYCYKTTQTLSPNTAKLAYFAGNFATAKIYSFLVEKEYSNVDLSYFQFNPYNYGKIVLGMEFGDHVGDWEHVTIRLAKFTYNGNTYVKPTMVSYPCHDFKNQYTWSAVTKVNTTHVVAYSAQGSHGMWKDSGSHVYKDIVIAKLTDECSQGTAWDTWNSLETYAYNAETHTGSGLGTSTWPSYFNNDYTNANSLCAARWGNDQDGSVFGDRKSVV